MAGSQREAVNEKCIDSGGGFLVKNMGNRESGRRTADQENPS